MGIKWFCDRCDEEVTSRDKLSEFKLEPGEDVPSQLYIPPKEICVACATQIFNEFKLVVKEAK